MVIWQLLSLLLLHKLVIILLFLEIKVLVLRTEVVFSLDLVIAVAGFLMVVVDEVLVETTFGLLVFLAFLVDLVQVLVDLVHILMVLVMAHPVHLVLLFLVLQPPLEMDLFFVRYAINLITQHGPAGIIWTLLFSHLLHPHSLIPELLLPPLPFLLVLTGIWTLLLHIISLMICPICIFVNHIKGMIKC